MVYVAEPFFATFTFAGYEAASHPLASTTCVSSKSPSPAIGKFVDPVTPEIGYGFIPFVV